MDRRTTHRLIELDNMFYQGHAGSFSATRQAPWRGWERVAQTARDLLPPGLVDGTRPMRAVDVACGNMRLLSFLLDAFPRARIDYRAIDGETGLLDRARRAETGEGAERARIHVQRLDILTALLDARPAPGRGDSRAARTLDAPAADLVCCFGFMHHVPGHELRRALVEELVGTAARGGIVALSCWRFMDDPRIAAQARAVTAEMRRREPSLALEPRDHFLGWQGDASLPRYCHHIDEPELDGLAAAARAAGASEVARFSADGRSGELNRYLILRVG